MDLFAARGALIVSSAFFERRTFSRTSTAWTAKISIFMLIGPGSSIIVEAPLPPSGALVQRSSSACLSSASPQILTPPSSARQLATASRRHRICRSDCHDHAQLPAFPCFPRGVFGCASPRNPTSPANSIGTLPRYLDTPTIEKIIASCRTETPVQIRDKAIILLLARLGLRAGDICQLRLSDIDWNRGYIQVSGKSKRLDRLPLPQDAGDALLAYLEQARPTVGEDRLFLRVLAPFTPFKSSAEICGSYRVCTIELVLRACQPGRICFAIPWLRGCSDRALAWSRSGPS